jgi:hypothetical protein
LISSPAKPATAAALAAALAALGAAAQRADTRLGLGRRRRERAGRGVVERLEEKARRDALEGRELGVPVAQDEDNAVLREEERRLGKINEEGCMKKCCIEAGGGSAESRPRISGARGTQQKNTRRIK